MLTQKRAAGILLHISSLPSSFGIGDMGPEAAAFATFLAQSGQHYWQILPLGPTGKEQAFSPYSSVSGMAGNTLLISPQLLVRDGLLREDDVLPYRLPLTDTVNYEAVYEARRRMFETAYANFRAQPQAAFESFCHREAFWLDDFALYMALKEHFHQSPWHRWPPEFKSRDLKALMDFTAKHEDTLTRIKWLQYIFFQQWRQLREHCKNLNISILGDLPFYMSHDSADVWSRPELFELTRDGTVAAMAGVPPDYFNSDGQLWGMPIYRWQAMKEQRYDWWVKRIRKNLELVDVLRLDHFRAFAAYWEVPAGEKTAVNGTWKAGPGAALFTVLEQEFGQLPFLAEDLGDIDDEVHRLRNRFGLPGMKVLQFAVGDDMATSDHIPHNFTTNFFAYTGTHDNNTTRGWFQAELKPEGRTQLERYAGQPVTAKNVNKVLACLAYGSVAAVVILPMQDVLGLDESARMNTPASTAGNWAWRLVPEEHTQREEDWLKQCAEVYGRQIPISNRQKGSRQNARKYKKQ